MIRDVRWSWCAAIVLYLVAACGPAVDTGNEPAIGDLRSRVAEIRALASSRQPDQAAAKIAELRGIVERLRARGEMSGPTAEEIGLAADAVLSQLALITTTTTSTPTTSTPTTTTETRPASDPPAKDKGSGKKKDERGKDD